MYFFRYKPVVIALAFLFLFAGCKKDREDFEIIFVTVSFDTKGGSKIESLEVKGGTAIKKPATPIKEGYDFLGWYNTSKLEQLFDFKNTLISKDITLYAKWKKKCPSYKGNLVLSNQKEVDAFNYCKVIGNLRIRGNDITNLRGLHLPPIYTSEIMLS